MNSVILSVAVLVLCLGVSQVASRKCYSCVTDPVDTKNKLTGAAPLETSPNCAGDKFKELTDAQKQELETTCANDDDQCGVWEKEPKEGKEGTAIYHRGCVTEAKCTELKGVTEDGDYDLETTCCKDADNCNGEEEDGDGDGDGDDKDGAQTMVISYLVLAFCFFLAKL